VDARTRRLESPAGDSDFARFSARHRASLVVLSGDTAGTEFDLDQPKLTLGRGAETELCFDDTAMSREHAVIEFAGGGFRIRDLGSTNGTRVNGERTRIWTLEHGDRITVGEHVLQFVVEQRELDPDTWEVPGN
jgi:pSer/pThr/pTyr-binding forkhead associated (FHA) protein